MSEIDPEDATAYYNRGWNHGRMNNHQLGKADRAEAIRLDPNLADLSKQ